MFIRGETLSAHSEIVLRGFRLFSLSNFTFGFHGFHLKKLQIIELIFEVVCGGKFSGEQ